MDKKIRQLFTDEQEIPEEVLENLKRNRNNLPAKEIKKISKRRKFISKRSLTITILVAIAVLFIAVTKTPIGSAIEKALGISRDSGVKSVEKQGIETDLNLKSVQNGREITLTKFVATKKKLAFDYQFEINDEKLKDLLAKAAAADWNRQFLDFELFAEGSSEEVIGANASNSTFRVEGNTFYGSVVSNILDEKIPDEANLILRISRLWWEDREKFEAAKAESLASPEPKSFSVGISLEYVGNWDFAVKYKPLTQVATPTITDSKNLTDIQATSDALQTTAKFRTSFDMNQSIAVDVYKNGVKDPKERSIEMHDLETGEITVSFNLSALDKTSVYKLQLNKINDSNGEALEEIGYVEFKNE